MRRPLRRRRRWFPPTPLGGLAALCALMLLVVAAALAYRSATLPTIDGTLALPGLSAPVDVVRDAAGVPHLFAANDDDAYFALGFVHAQDRLWQMELNRRTAAGRLAEVLGPAALDTDRFLRTLGIGRNAAAIAERLDERTRRALARYAAGVNAELDARRRRPHGLLPPEFVATGAPFPEPWTPADSVGWSTMMAWDLSTNWSAELARMRLSQRLTKAQIDELMPPYPGNAAAAPHVAGVPPERPADAQPRTGGDAGRAPVAIGSIPVDAKPDPPLEVADYPSLYRRLTIDAQALSERAAAAFALAPSQHIEGIGSNNWVVSGARTASGKPLLANDPHLSLTAPALFYLAHLSTPDLDVIGATLPGLPFVVLGRNARIAWGMTNTGPDTQDLFIEALRDHDGATEVRTPDGWQPLSSRDEIIRVKGEADHRLVVRASRHGPLISDVSTTAADALQPIGGARYAIAFQWAALRPDDRTLQAGLALNRATDWSSFVDALRDFHAPQQNFVYADVDGHIGFIAPGRVPVRKPENDLKGQVPAPGWDARYDWDGFVPFDRLPQQRDPPSGRIVTANHKIVPDDYGPFLTSEWTPPFRARRIESLLDAAGPLDVDGFAAIQADVRSLAAVQVLPMLLDTKPSSDVARSALARLSSWDGTMRGDRAEPLIYATWMRELTRLVTRDELGPTLFAAYWEPRTVFMIDVLADRGGRARWCDDITTPVVETCAEMKTRALDLALADLTRRVGPDPDRWRWDALHVVRAEHRPFGRVPLLAPLFDLAGPVGGDGNTIDVGGYAMRDETNPFVARHGPSVREIVDLADAPGTAERSRFVASTGVSGNRWSPWYGHLFDRWRRVESVPMQRGRPAIEAEATATLHLVP